MPKAIIGSGTADGLVHVSTAADNVVLSGHLYEDGKPVDTWEHQALKIGAPFTVRTGHTYQVIVNAMFTEQGRADVVCRVGSRSTRDALARSADDCGLDLEIAQFHIYPGWFNAR